MLTFCIVLLSLNPLFACPWSALVIKDPDLLTLLVVSRLANCLFFFFFLRGGGHSPSPHVPCTILISLFIMSLVNLSAFFLYVQILEFEMDFFSPFI